jgi:hypothetical protein
MKCVVVLVMIGDTGMGAEGGRKNWEVIPGKHSADSVQKTAVLGT